MAISKKKFKKTTDCLMHKIYRASEKHLCHLKQSFGSSAFHFRCQRLLYGLLLVESLDSVTDCKAAERLSLPSSHRHHKAGSLSRSVFSQGKTQALHLILSEALVDFTNTLKIMSVCWTTPSEFTKQTSSDDI